MKIAGLMAAVAILATPQAKASLIFSFNNGNPAISSYPTPYGTLSLSLSDAHDATVTLSAAPGYLFGDGGTVALNLAPVGTVSVVGGVGGILGNGGAYSLGGAGNQDGFGNFNFSIDTFDGFTHASSSLTFILTTTSVTGWANEAAILTPNGDGFEVAGHVYVLAPDGKSALATGYSTAAVPEPTTMIAGALLLLPFGASTLRILHKKHTA